MNRFDCVYVGHGIATVVAGRIQLEKRFHDRRPCPGATHKLKIIATRVLRVTRYARNGKSESVSRTRETNRRHDDRIFVCDDRFLAMGRSLERFFKRVAEHARCRCCRWRRREHVKST